MPFAQAEQTASHFSTLNTKITNQNVLKRIFFAMLNENMADSNENFRICSDGICSASVQAVGFIRPLGVELQQKLV